MEIPIPINSNRNTYNPEVCCKKGGLENFAKFTVPKSLFK